MEISRKKTFQYGLDNWLVPEYNTSKTTCSLSHDPGESHKCHCQNTSNNQ